MTVYKSPSKILDELGITEPCEIQIEAIAQYCGALVLYERLEGCAARILGNGSEAIITVDDRTPLERRRFSAAHELGHWMRDRDKIRFSCTEQAMQSEWGPFNAEHGANQYAADLLLPESMLVRAAKNKPLTLDSAAELGGIFRTSLTATAISLLRYGSFPGMLIYIENGKRKWFIRGEGVPECLWPHQFPLAATYAADLINSERQMSSPAAIQADGWINHPRSQWYEVVEHSVRVSSNGILTILWWKNEKQLLDLNEDE
jgi:Zn-dependent peptidase ImmA (M78 family)